MSEHEECGRPSNLPDGKDKELDSGTGYESACEGLTTQRRKMSSESEDDQKKEKKKRRKDKDREKQDGEPSKTKVKSKKDTGDKYRERDGFLEHDWEQNKTFKTFFIEPTEESKHIHIMEIARTLHSIKITNYTELKTAGKNRYKITFSNPRHAENLINSKILTETFKYRIYVPSMFKQTIGVVRDIPPSLPDEEIFEKLESERVKITKVERIQKMVKGKLVPTYSVKIFAEGEKLPKEVSIFGIPRVVDVFIFPLKYCLRCLRYGHRVKACKSGQTRCYVCANPEHEGNTCTSLDVRCFHCAGSHKAFDVNCKERFRQDNINKSMAYNKLTFSEAEKRYPRQTQTEIRLQSNEDFPPIDSNKENIQAEINWSGKNTHENPTEKYITKSELEKIVNSLKMELVKQLNMNKLISKIKQIAGQIDVAINTDKPTKTNNVQVLKNISEQLNEIINPEFLKPSTDPNPTQVNPTSLKPSINPRITQPNKH